MPSFVEVHYYECRLFSYGIVRRGYLHHQHCLEVSACNSKRHYRHLWSRLVVHFNNATENCYETILIYSVHETRQLSSLWRCGPTRAMASSFLRFLDHIQWHITVGRTPLDAWSVCRRDLYLTTHTTLTTDRHPYPGGIRTHNLSRPAAEDLRLRPLGHWDRQQDNFLTGTCQLAYVQLFVCLFPSELDASRHNNVITKNKKALSIYTRTKTNVTCVAF